MGAVAVVMPRKRLSREEKRAETRAALLDAAARVFAERGFGAASIEQIAESAGFSRGAFYSNFAGKKELMAELLARELVQRAEDYARLSEQSADVVEHMRRAGAWTTERAERGLVLFLEFIAQGERDPEFRPLIANFLRGLREATAQEFERGARMYGIELPLPPAEIASLAMAIAYGLAIQNLADPEEVPRELAPRLFSMVFSGVPGEGWRPE